MNGLLWILGGLTLAIGTPAPGPVMVAAAAPETFTATASVKSGSAAASAQVTFRIDRFVSDAERDRILTVIKGNDPAAIRAALEKAPDIGYIEVGTRRTPIKYAYARSTGDGRLLTVVTAQPVAFVGGSAPGAKAPKGFELALAALILDGKDNGDGEIAPAAQVKMNESGAIVTTDYAHEVVRLTAVKRVK